MPEQRNPSKGTLLASPLRPRVVIAVVGIAFAVLVGAVGLYYRNVLSWQHGVVLTIFAAVSCILFTGLAIARVQRAEARAAQPILKPRELSRLTSIDLSSESSPSAGADSPSLVAIARTSTAASDPFRWTSSRSSAAAPI
jgi:hypothetical protein